MATKQRGRPPIPKLTEAKLLKCYNDLLHVDMMDHKSVNAFCIVCDRLLSDYYEKNHKRIFNRTTKYKEWYQDILIHHEKYDEEYARQAYANYMDMMMLEARHLQLDSYLLLLEWNRPEKEKFYKPRRGCLLRHGVIQGLQDLLDDEIDVLSISLPPGTGKAQPLYSRVLTPFGFRKMGDLKVGDLVIGGTGKPSKILGIYPQGIKDIYELTFDDGSKCRCSDNHLWTVQTRDDRLRNKSRTVELAKIRGNLKCENGKRLNYSIQYVPKIEFEEKRFLIHPYIMGVLIGNGGLTALPPIISTADKEVVDNVNKFLPDGYILKHKDRYDYLIHGHEGNNCKAGSLISRAIKEYGLAGHKSHEKFIPKDYLYASYKQRLWLLRGLMDTDGWGGKTSAGYCTTSEELAHDVIELIHSLGGYASVSTKKAGYKKDGEYVPCKLAYIITIQFTSQMESIFALERKSKLYKPKRSEIKRFIKDVQYVGQEVCQCIYIDDPTHLYITDDYILTHNTTIEMFFLTGVMGWFPEDFNLFYSHSGDIVKMFYRGCLDIITNDDYQWAKIFPNIPLERTDAGLEQINVGKFKTFPSLQTTSVGSKNAGKVRASKFLCVDDMISGIDEALNRNTLDKLWNNYSVDARQRKLDGCKELHIATRWSVADIIGRLQHIYGPDYRARFIAVPDIDPTTKKSNFEYENGVGFSVEFFRSQAAVMDDISYRCLYKQEPIEREGLLYHEDELRRFDAEPTEEPDAVWAICDTKTTGTDYMFMPIISQYGDDFYCVACVCDNSTDIGALCEDMGRQMIVWRVNACEFESNAGGAVIASNVADFLKSVNWRHTTITTKPTETNKETRIIAEADWVKKNVLFRQTYRPNGHYAAMMKGLLTYSIAGKNLHDDVPDGFANLSRFLRRKFRKQDVEIIRGGLM